MRFQRCSSGGLCAWSACVSVLLVGCGKPAVGFAPPPPPKVTIGHPVVQPVEEVLELRGTTHPAERVEIRVRVRGYVAERFVEGGQTVKAGDRLLKLDAREFEASLRQAQAELAAAEGRRTLSAVELDRLQQIADRGAGTAIELDRAKATLAVSDAQVELAKAAVETARINLSYTEITSPINGRLGIDLPDLGTLLDPQANPLVTTVADDSVILARYTIDETYVLELRRRNETRRPSENGRPNIPLRMGLGSGDDYPFRGEHFRADNTFDARTGTVQVEGRFENPDFAIIPGMYCRVQAIIGQREATLVPESAMLSDQAGRFVYTLDTEDRAQRVSVQPGRRVGAMRVVTAEGLTPQSRLIVNGLMRVQAGAPVNPSSAAAPTP